MPTRKISDNTTPQQCHHHDHNPPSMMCFEPGVYEHECPSCKKKVTFTVHSSSLVTPAKDDGWAHVHYVNVGNVPPKDVMAYVQGVRDSMKFIPVR